MTFGSWFDCPGKNESHSTLSSALRFAPPVAPTSVERNDGAEIIRIGALLGHIIMGLTPSYLSVFGMLALAGVVVNDSLVMVDYINRRRAEGLSLREAAFGTELGPPHPRRWIIPARGGV